MLLEEEHDMMLDQLIELMATLKKKLESSDTVSKDLKNDPAQLILKILEQECHRE